jgi:hypothetical protein
MDKTDPSCKRQGISADRFYRFYHSKLRGIGLVLIQSLICTHIFFQCQYIKNKSRHSDIFSSVLLNALNVDFSTKNARLAYRAFENSYYENKTSLFRSDLTMMDNTRWKKRRPMQRHTIHYFTA